MASARLHMSSMTMGSFRTSWRAVDLLMGYLWPFVSMPWLLASNVKLCKRTQELTTMSNTVVWTDLNQVQTKTKNKFKPRPKTSFHQNQTQLLFCSLLVLIFAWNHLSKAGLNFEAPVCSTWVWLNRQGIFNKQWHHQDEFMLKHQRVWLVPSICIELHSTTHREIARMRTNIIWFLFRWCPICAGIPLADQLNGQWEIPQWCR